MDILAIQAMLVTAHHFHFWMHQCLRLVVTYDATSIFHDTNVCISAVVLYHMKRPYRRWDHRDLPYADYSYKDDSGVWEVGMWTIVLFWDGESYGG